MYYQKGYGGNTHEEHERGGKEPAEKRGVQIEGLGREESRRAATELAKAAMREDRKNGIESSFGIARDAFGHYFAAQING